ncbi:hypothetical protein Trydic_g8296 [Trypoxylus dichotomus]
MGLGRKVLKQRLAIWFRIGTVLSITLAYIVIGFASRSFRNGGEIDQTIEGHVPPGGGRKLLSLVADYNCTPSAIKDFPSDGLTREQRQHGWAIIHALLACYFFMLMGIVCEGYFVPAVKSICANLHMKEDVTGATFMAIAGSSSELFINCVGTFITEGDIGVGTVVGSAVFNVLAVPACCGLLANMVLQLEWWPVTRDSAMYAIAVSILIKILGDEKVYLAEAIVLILAYILYLAVMYFNENIINAITRLRRTCRRRYKHRYQEILSETHPLLVRCEKNGCANFIMANGDITLKDCEELEDSTNIWKWPTNETKPRKCFWVLTWPISLILYLSTPDCKKYPRLTALTFLMCVFWIGSTSYLVAWLITIIGDTLDIPDSVMGLTFLAAGTSVPEAVSSIIVANQGHGAMGVSSSIGSNTFDILLCLGIPWLFKTWLYPKDPGDHSIIINSSGLAYNACLLLSTLVLFYISLFINKFRLDWKIGLFCLLLYLTFLCFATLIELNVFLLVNLPSCDR